ncbi:hypothetical protein N7481_007675 [Penicillium waksmanii]|uniref:uncharacterized protein n=1 Tax=Penicillium waksmanii TaxID=69791 RepID=UPI002546EC62|nr:uncharacterized protein N7481_007675 [Penicillium waksmanii]KAJ5980377.1 hypothetical protein N7481_007675 [Penicillium waksmanii]
MSDSIPSATEPADQPPLPANAEDRKAAAALSSLNTTELASSDASPAKGRSNAEQEALDRAMNRLEIAAGQGGAPRKSSQPLKETEVKKTVKIAAADVSFLAEQLDVHKSKATELLRAQEGDVTRAMRAFITPSFRA